MSKKYTIKQFDKNGVYKGVIADVSDYRFSKTKNGGVGQSTIIIPKKFDDYGDIELLDGIEIWVQDNETSGLLIYSGYIDNIRASIRGNEESVVLQVIGYTARLGYTLDITGTSISIDRQSVDPEDAVKDVIDNYNALVTNPKINYTAGSTETAGFNISYTSNSKMCLESIDRITEMAGSEWYWYVDANNVFYFKSKPTTATHNFVFGKDISALEVNKSMEGVVNNLIFWNGLQPDDENYLSNNYYSPLSITAYWHRYGRLTDSRITDSTTAEKLGDAYVKANQNPNTEIVITIKDNNFGLGYDIESIEPGQTCNILNVKDADIYGANLQITKVDYTPEYAIVYCEDSRNVTGRSLSDIRRSLDTTIYGDGAGNITLVDID